MVEIARDVPNQPPGKDASSDAPTARQLHWRLIWLYVQGSVTAVVVTFFLVFLGLEFSGYQWLLLLAATPLAVPIYVLLDIYVINRHYRPLGRVLAQLDAGENPAQSDISRAIVSALNLPFLSFIRVTFIHGPAATVVLVTFLTILHFLFDGGYRPWQIFTFAALVLFFASPTHAVLEFFALSRHLVPTIERLWRHCDSLDDAHAKDVTWIRLREKLLFLSIFITAFPLVVLIVSIALKGALLLDIGVDVSSAQIWPLWFWLVGVALVCIGGALIMSVLTAGEVSRSAARLITAMHDVEEGHLNERLHVSSTDEYGDLFRGFNLMVDGLRDEAHILDVTQELAGELHLDALLVRIMTAVTELLGAERSTLFVRDQRTDELWSRFAEGLDVTEIRMAANDGIAGAVFQSGEAENIGDPYSHPLFNPEIDRQTNFTTESILCVPITNKAGERIGVTQVLNKRDGAFTAKDEARLRAFTAQVAVSLENARLFEDVLNMKNYNESILKSTTNGMITLDTERNIVTANDAAVAIMATERETIVDRPAGHLFADDNRWVMNSIANVEASGASDMAVDADLRLTSGESASVNLMVVPLIDAADENIGSMVILEDISNEKRVKTTMARYMSKEVVDQLLEAGESELGGKNQHVSILFSDVRNFTTISETIGARETVSMLNEYFAVMVEILFENNGILDKYIGDAMMALFGAPFDGPHDADNAVIVANQMVSALDALNAERARDSKDPIDIGIGISTGEVVVGNIGSPKRMEYTVIGDSVNLASRLEGANKFYGTKILLSGATVNDMTVKMALREIDLMRVKGKDRPVTVFEALDYHTEESFPGLATTLEAYKAGLASYRARDWRAAIDSFEAALAANRRDRPSELYLDRARHYFANPPGDDWDGVWVMTEK